MHCLETILIEQSVTVQINSYTRVRQWLGELGLKHRIRHFIVLITQ